MNDILYQFALWRGQYTAVELWAMCFYALQVGDAITTYVALKMGGREGNPVVRKVIETIGLIPALLIFKALSVAGVYYGANAMGADVLTFWTLFYVGVVGWNIAQINKLRGRK